MFDEFADLLYTNREQWVDLADPQLVFDSYAQELGLDLTQFTADRQSAEADASINDDEADAAALGLTNTPSLFLRGRPLNSSFALQDLAGIIEAELDLFENPFVIDRATGDIMVSRAFSSDASAVETFDVRISDLDGNSVIETVTVNVTA